MAAPPPDVYLADDFDTTSLKVPQLRSLLLEYNVLYPATAKKPELVQLFDQHVRPLAATLKARSAQVKASAKGIVAVSENGEEELIEPAAGKKRRGRPKKSEVKEEDIEAEPPTKRPRGRPKKESTVDTVASAATPRASRRTSRKPTDNVPDVIVKAETPLAPVRARGRLSVPPSPAPRSSAAPSSQRRSMIPSSSSVTSELHTPSESTIIRTPAAAKTEFQLKVMDDLPEERSEPEEPTVPPPSTIKKTPRRSKVEDSAFSDFNPFQSGSEEAAERERRRRKSSLGLPKQPQQPRYSAQALPSSPDEAQAAEAVSPEPAPRSPSLPTPPSTTTTKGKMRRISMDPNSARKARLAQEDLAATGDYSPTTAVERYNREVSDRIGQLSRQEPGHEVSVRTQKDYTDTVTQRVAPTLPSIAEPRTAVPLGLLLLMLLGMVGNYKTQSSAIGYCDTGANMNDIILSRQSMVEEAKACVAEKADLALGDKAASDEIQCDVSSLPLVPFVPQPYACAPCPQHAICEDGRLVACESEYILSPHTLAVISPLMDGLPGVGPVAFAPSCKPDTYKKRMIGGLALQMEKDLARGRGVIVCAGLGKDDGRKGEGERFGMEESTLKERYSVRRDPKFSQEQFDEIFEAALKDLVEHGDVIESIDVDGKSWYGAARTDLTIACQAKLRAIQSASEWKSELTLSSLMLAGILYLRSLFNQRKTEKFRAEELVLVVLKRLQDQEHLHYVDPVQTPQPFVPPAQLRDLVLPPSGSVSSRSRLWERVVELVEKNANVATREQEVKGEVWKTWEWTGMGERHIRFD